MNQLDVKEQRMEYDDSLFDFDFDFDFDNKN